MKLTHVETLLALAECGSVRAAAARLQKSQPVLTKRLQQMEEEAGITLFQRTSRGIVPTDAGLSILARARSVEAELTRLSEEIASLSGCQTGSIRVSATPLAAIKIMPRAISRFRKVFPEIGINMTSDLYSDALKALREGHTHIIIGPFADASKAKDIHSEALFETEMALITSKDAEHANATSLRELTGCNWVLLWNNTENPGRRLQELFSTNNLAVPRIPVASESQLGVFALVKELKGVSILPAQLIEGLDDKRGIVRLNIKEHIAPLTISMLMRAGRPLTPAGEVLANCIRHRTAVLTRAWVHQEGTRLKA